MPFIAIVTPEIPAANKDEFLAAWPSIKSDIAARPEVLGSSGGEVIGENGGPVTEFKFIQSLAFKSAEDEKAFGESAWAKDHFEKAKAKMPNPPKVRKFETSDFPDEKPKGLTQLTFLEVADPAKHDGAKQAWLDLVAAIGGKSFGGRSVDDGPATGLGFLGWDSKEQAIETYKKPEVAAAWDNYKSFGNATSILVKLEA